MKIFGKFLILVLLPLSTAVADRANNQSPQKMQVLETTMEGPFSDFSLSSDLNGSVKTEECETDIRCKNITVKITPDVRAILDGQEVPLGYFIKSSHQPSSLHFNNKTKKLARIIWFSPTSTKR